MPFPLDFTLYFFNKSIKKSSIKEEKINEQSLRGINPISLNKKSANPMGMHIIIVHQKFNHIWIHQYCFRKLYNVY